MFDFLSDSTLEAFFAQQPMFVVLACIAMLLMALGKSADKLVGEAVVLSERSGLPKVVIGATVVSLGTTSPEAAVSVLAALHGNAELALGNAVGSIICDTGLILGVACLIDPPQLPRAIVNRQGWIQLASALLLVAACWPYQGDGVNPWHDGGRLTQGAGWLFVGLLVVYMALSVRWARSGGSNQAIVAEIEEIEAHAGDAAAPAWKVVVKLGIAIALVVLSSHLLIPAIKQTAIRMGVPPAVVAATLVAFGTSLPELVTAVTASRKGHGDLAVGNVIGADILNVLFVSGLSAAVTSGGLAASPDFFRLLFPAMLGILALFRIGVVMSPDRLPRSFGAILVGAYLVYMVLSYTLL